MKNGHDFAPMMSKNVHMSVVEAYKHLSYIKPYQI